MTRFSQGFAQLVIPETAIQSSPLEILQPEMITSSQLEICIPSSFGTLRLVSMFIPVSFTFRTQRRL